jgi:putative phage-type endonuclease
MTATLADDLRSRAVAWPDTPDWHQRRAAGIGASEIAAVVGLSKYATPLDVYLRKTGQIHDVIDNRAMRVGRRLEPVVIGEFCEETGEEVALYPCPMVAHPDHPYMLATPDADLVSGRLVEAKTASLRTLRDWGPEGTDELPDQYLCQCQHQLAVTGRDECKLAVLIAGDELRVYTVERNERLIGQLTEAAAEFWSRVERRDPPAPDLAHPRTPELLRGLYGSIADDQVVTLGPEAREHWAEYESLGRQIGELEKRRKLHQASVVAAIGGHLGGDLGDGRFVKRIKVDMPERVQAAYSYIQLRACKVAKG